MKKKTYNNRFALNPKAFNDYIYKNISNYTKRIELYYGGAGSGKSHGVLQKVILKCINYKRRVLIIRKVGATLKESVFGLTRRILAENNMLKYVTINKSDFVITFLNGSEIIFKGLDDPEKIKSIDNITDIVIEEATELTLDDYTQLSLRLRANAPNLQIYLMFNPISKSNWVYQYFFINELDDTIKIVHTTYKNNKFLPNSYIKELNKLKNKNPAYYKIYVLGEFATLDKLIYPMYEKRLISKEEVKGLERIQGLDFGYTNDPSALIGGYYDKVNNKIYITDEYVKKGMLNNEIADVFYKLGMQKDLTFADCAEPKSIDELKRLGVRVTPASKGKDSIIQGIQWINQHTLIIDERCKNTIEELDNYTWKKDKKTGEYINEPVDNFNHCLDALRYSLNNQIKGGMSIKIYNKKDFLTGRSFF